jgi:NADH-quinone oxidoreductase subunit L
MSLPAQLQKLLVSASDVAHAATSFEPQRFVDVHFLWLIPFFPLVGAILNAFFGKAIQDRWGKKACSHLAIAAMALSFFVALAAFGQMVALPEHERYLRDFLWNMFTAGDLQANFSFALDPLSMMMVLIITFIGTLIHIYSTGYMADEPAYWRFFCYLNLFVFSMLLLVMGDNFALMFFGWEGVGLCSYLLIGFWYEDPEKARAANKAFITNRFGDFGFILGLFLLFWALGGGWTEGGSYARDSEFSPSSPPATFSELERPSASAVREGVRVGPTLTFRELRDQISIEPTGVKERLLGMSFFGMPLLAVVGILLFVGATAKSAQIPLYVWLPDAMAGPTPVSALIHAATMVTAGVYMVARLNFLFALSPLVMTVIAVIGAATALFAATIGFVQNDIKKVLAYSTVSQLGFMFIGVGVGAYWAGVYHLLTHAFFKACLFLGSGSVILGCHHEQDMRKMGGLKQFMPITEKTYRYACIAIAGFPIANGFFSKDEILAKAFDAGHNLLTPGIGKWVWFIGWITACGTSFYMWRSYYMTFTGTYRGDTGGHGHGHGHDAGGHAPAVLATHSVGAAHAATFGSDVMASVVHGAEDVAHKKDDHASGHPAGHADHPDHKAEGGHGHGGTPHESPLAMTAVLVALAIGCAVTIVLGFWAPLGHLIHADWLAEPLLERWLAPVLDPSLALVLTRREPSPMALEWLLIGASVAVAFLGWWTARVLYKDAKSTVPEKLQKRFSGLHRVVYNKYYVDEFYQATVIRGSLLLGRAWSAFDRIVIDGIVNGVAVVGRFIGNIDGAIDKHLVDGAVNALADSIISSGQKLRRLQSGKLRHYLYAALAGAVVVVGINYLVR